MQGEEAVQGRIINGITTPEPGDDGLAKREGREEVGDHHRTPQRHLSPGQHVAHESRCHHQKQNDDAEDPQHFARCFVGAIIQTAKNVQIHCYEEHRGTVHVEITQQPTIIHVTHDVLDRIEGVIDMRRVMHRQNDAGDDLHHQHDHEDAAEGPEIIQIFRCGISYEGGMHQADDWQASLEPFGRRRFRNIG